MGRIKGTNRIFFTWHPLPYHLNKTILTEVQDIAKINTYPIFFFNLPSSWVHRAPTSFHHLFWSCAGLFRLNNSLEVNKFRMKLYCYTLEHFVLFHIFKYGRLSYKHLKGNLQWKHRSMGGFCFCFFPHKRKLSVLYNVSTLNDVLPSGVGFSWGRSGIFSSNRSARDWEFANSFW